MTSAQVTDRLRLYFYKVFERENPMPSARVGFYKILLWERERSSFISSNIERLGFLDDRAINNWLEERQQQ